MAAGSGAGSGSRPRSRYATHSVGDRRPRPQVQFVSPGGHARLLRSSTNASTWATASAANSRSSPSSTTFLNRRLTRTCLCATWSARRSARGVAARAHAQQRRHRAPTAREPARALPTTTDPSRRTAPQPAHGGAQHARGWRPHEGGRIRRDAQAETTPRGAPRQERRAPAPPGHSSRRLPASSDGPPGRCPQSGDGHALKVRDLRTARPLHPSGHAPYAAKNATA